MAKLNSSVYRILLDVQDSVSPYEIHVKVGDTNSRTIQATFADGGVPLSFTDEATATFMSANSAGQEAYTGDATVSKNTVSYQIPATMMAAVGEYSCEFWLDSVEGGAVPRHITSPSFKIIVEPTVVTAS